MPDANADLFEAPVALAIKKLVPAAMRGYKKADIKNSYIVL
jgi:hypothetical protein